VTSGEILTKVTIWVAILGYAFGSAAFALSRNKHQGNSLARLARLAWTTAGVALLAHVFCAFHFYHGWSESVAYRETARQTDEVFGLNWGGGLYVNYSLIIGWVVDVGWWWVRGVSSYRRRPRFLMAAWHGFLIFIIFNATVVFKTGLVRWAGLCICVGLCLVWWLAFMNSPKSDELAMARE
jgi:hypothetical protein